MDDMLSFISKRIKQIDGLSMQRFVSLSGLTRSKFYRYLQEPYRFSEEELSTIASILNLGQDDREELFRFKWGENEESNQDVKESIHRFIFNNRPVELDLKSKSYTLFDEISLAKIITKLSAYELANRLSSWVKQQFPEDEAPILHVRIINCISKEKVRMIYSLLKAIGETTSFARYQIKTVHIINSEKMELKDKFDTLFEVSSLFNSSNYHVHFEPFNNSIWETMDCCLAECSSVKGTKLFSFAVLPSNYETLLYIQSNQMMTDFFNYSFNELFSFESIYLCDLGDPLSLNKMLTDSTLKNHKLTFESVLYIDNFSTDMWKRATGYIKNNPEIIQKMRLYADPKNTMGDFDDSQFIEFLFDGCIRRYLASEATSSINVLLPDAFRYFVDNNGIKDFEVMGLILPDDLVLLLLENIKERLGDHRKDKMQSYYITNPLTKGNLYWLSIYRESFFHLFTSYDKQNTFLNGIVPYPEISASLYDYFVNELLPDSKREHFESPIMSDERATAFIDSLIEEVKTRMASI